MPVHGLEGSILQPQIFTISPSAAIITAGSSATFDMSNYKAVEMIVSVTTGGLTVTTFRVWPQGSGDAGLTWVDLPVTNVAKSVLGGVFAGTAGVATAIASSLCNEAGNVTGTTTYIGSVVALPLMRVAWNIVGTSPSETFSVIGIGKMV